MTTTTLNPVDKYVDIVLSNGNLTATYTPAPAGQGSSGPTPSNDVNVRATQPGVSGRYFEVTVGTLVAGQAHSVGIGLANASQSLTAYPGIPNGIGWFANGYAEWPGSGFSNNFGTFATGDVLGVLLEASDAKFYKNGILAGTATQLPTGALYPIISLANATESSTANFGATPLAYLPTGATSWDGTQTKAPPPPATGLNPQNKFADIVLSNNNFTATYTTTRSSGNVNVLGAQSGVAGRYFEFTFSKIVTAQISGPGIGVCNSSQALASYPGSPNGASWFSNGYAEWLGSGSANNFGAFSTGDVLGVLLEASDVKFYKNGTLVGTATGLPSGTLYPVVSLANNTESGTANFGATPMAFLPVGASSWDGSQFGGTGTGAGGQTTTTTFALNPSDKAPSVTLSNGNLTATTTTTAGAVRGTATGVADKYFEVTFTAIGSGAPGSAPGIGIANASQALVNSYPGDPNGVGWFANGYTEWPGSGTSLINSRDFCRRRRSRRPSKNIRRSVL
jgi:hypothetical protein